MLGAVCLCIGGVSYRPGKTLTHLEPSRCLALAASAASAAASRILGLRGLMMAIFL